MKAAYVTLLAHGDGYRPGVEALGHSLDQTGTRAPRVAMVTPDVSTQTRQALGSAGWRVREIDPIDNPRSDELFSRHRHVYSKLRLWELTEFEQVVFLDADTVVLRNIDELFERPDFAAAPDFLLPDQFNSGVLVATPSHDTFQRMVAALHSSPSYDGGDQGFLNEFYRDWYTGPSVRRLPSGFNTHHFIYQFISSHPVLSRQVGPTIRVVHYTMQKPWVDWPPTFTGGADTWWRHYYAAHPAEDRPWKRRMRALQDGVFDRVVDWVVR